MLAAAASVPEPEPAVTTADCQSTLRSMEDVKQQTAYYRRLVDMYHNWAPVDAGVCVRLLDEIDAQVAIVEGRAIRGEPVELDTLQRLLDQFHLAGMRFKQAAKHK